MSDVLIVGAGSAGSVLTERLSADPSCHVTLVESGPAPSDPRVHAQITDGLRLPIGPASSVVRRYPTTLTVNPERHGQIMRGAVIGGSGAINGGYFCRGLPSDFADWSLPGWSWAEVLPHFKALETDLDFQNDLHGTDGPITVRRVREFDGCTAAFVEAATRAGYPWIADLNGSTPEAPVGPGVGPVPLNINQGTRVGPGGAILAPALDRPNLTLLADTRVVAVRIRDGRAVGVTCVGAEGRTDLDADRVVLCAGAVGSAQLLMLSGVGPAGVLRTADIRVVANLPVGAAIADHPEWVVPVHWDDTHGVPPLEAVLTTADGLEIRSYTAGFGAMVTGRRNDPGDHPHIGVTLMRPRSRGRVTVVSADPDRLPHIEHRYDTDATDVDLLSAGVELVREIVGPATELGPVSWSTSQHLARTAPMGTDDDPDAVVDPQCRVRGIDRLWVVDGSVLPVITSRGPHATICMIGHRAAEFIV
ncbi:mycofactocin dehydrogenase MftG [Mycolicibacterium phlei]